MMLATAVHQTFDEVLVRDIPELGRDPLDVVVPGHGKDRRLRCLQRTDLREHHVEASIELLELGWFASPDEVAGHEDRVPGAALLVELLQIGRYASNVGIEVRIFDATVQIRKVKPTER